jgi:ADP-dependent NAD(P)H-hydrate dehydratase / NAD(P)H-hydrate epimerase
VVTSAEAARDDARTIALGVPSRALMQRAGAAAATEISLRYSPLLGQGALVFAGPGNNGGDGWVVAGALARSGVRVRVCEPAAVGTADARAERELALPWVQSVPLAELAAPVAERVIVDALLGTGGAGEPRGELARAIQVMTENRAAGAKVVALDVPSGLDAATGGGAVVCPASLTVSFGAMKRGLLVSRSLAGRIVVLDIGLAAGEPADEAPILVDERWARARLPMIAAEAHKGGRGKVAVVGGAAGMAGATILASRAAQRSGAGMVKLIVAPESMASVQRGEPTALAAPWTDAVDECGWADAVAVGPGLGATAASRALVESVLRAWEGPILLDADALNVFAGDVDSLASMLNGRPAIITPHPMELARLIDTTVDRVLEDRFAVGEQLAERLGAVVLLKGVPTVISAAGQPVAVSARGTPALAAAGSGDLLAGIGVTLLAQLRAAPFDAAAIAALVHGRAGEIASGVSATGGGRVRGVTIDDVLAALPAAWALPTSVSRYPVMAELPDVAENSDAAFG